MTLRLSLRETCHHLVRREGVSVLPKALMWKSEGKDGRGEMTSRLEGSACEEESDFARWWFDAHICCVSPGCLYTGARVSAGAGVSWPRNDGELDGSSDASQ